MVTVLPENVFRVMQIESVIIVFILFFSSIHHVHLLLSSTSNFMTEYFPYMIRSANVLEGAHVQWEIELLSFEMPKVIYKIP